MAMFAPIPLPDANADPFNDVMDYFLKMKGLKVSKQTKVKNYLKLKPTRRINNSNHTATKTHLIDIKYS